ncbi:L-seryl-tRNA(Sec) selenium transferase [bacterium]|nr:L-seryl-tRNA(Sec) selenium transferase [bacterium]MDA7527809.1 L-seryl-tRNA(Sec) selenium transferase [bacterium]
MSPHLDYRRRLPSVDSLLRSQHVESLLTEGVPRSLLLSWIREELESLRATPKIELSENELLTEVQQRLSAKANSDASRKLGRVINGTGIILHTNLGRSPLAESARKCMQDVAGYCNVEFQKEEGHRGQRGERVVELLKALTGAEDALIVNNCAAATWLALQDVVGAGEAIISRGQLVEIGGSYRLPEIALSAKIRLHEVGTTNRTYLRDYENAIQDSTRALLRIHRSNFVISGFVCEPSLEELVNLGRQRSICVIDDLGSGSLYDLSKFGLSDPTIQESVATGADLILFSGDKLLGGPQCGIILGQSNLIKQLRMNPLTRALRVGKSTLAGLEATLEIHLAGNGFKEIPILQMLATPLESLYQRSHDIRNALLDSPLYDCISVSNFASHMGGGTLPEQQVASAGLRVEVNRPERVSQFLRLGPFAIASRIFEGAIAIDLRTVAPNEDSELIDALQSVPADLVAGT